MQHTETLGTSKVNQMRHRAPNHGPVALIGAVIAAVAVAVAAFAQTPSLISVEAQKRIIDAPGVPVFGATRPEVVVVEYFDFNCPFCRKLAPSFLALLKAEPKVAVVYKDWPIFGGVSVYAARCALAAQWQGQYGKAHEALISAPRLSENEQVDEALRRAGIDMSRIHQDLHQHAAEIESLLTRNSNEARALGIRGTPGILVGRQTASNVADLADLQAAVSRARASLTR
jgi:protein-disulfide isomerase